MPTVTSINPNSGINNGPVSITDLAGTNFFGTPTVQLKMTGQTSITATGVVLSGSTDIFCVFDLTGAAAGSWDVTVTNPDNQSATLTGGFTVNNAAPTITSITPNSGTNNGTVSITNLAGSGFYGTPTVQLKRPGQTSITATGVAVPSSTKITCSFNLTGAAAGSWDVYVQNQDGQNATLTGGFTVNNPAPTLSSISPTSATEGTSADYTLTATGTNFVTASVVKWNGTALATTYVSSTSLTAIIPKAYMAGAGTYSVTVTNPAPGGGTSGSKTFTVNSNNVTLTYLWANSVSVGSGDQTYKWVYGTNFSSNPRSVVQWNGTTLPGDYTGNTQHYASSGDIDYLVIPSSYLTTAGTFYVTVYTPASNGEPGGTSSNPLPFQVSSGTEPTISTLHLPTLTVGSGDQGGTVFSAYIWGTNFNSSSVVQWNGTPLTSHYVGSTDIDTITIPASCLTTPGTFYITVSNVSTGGGISDPQAVTVNNTTPSLSSISPTSANAGSSDTTLTLTGTNFSSTAIVNWAGAPLSTTYGSGTSLTATIPAADMATAGSYSVTVTNPGSGGGTSGGKTFTVNNPAPTLSSISPTSATAGTTTTLVLTGTNFNTSSVVNWNGSSTGITTTYVDYSSGTILTAALPAVDMATAGTFSVTVTNPTPGGGTSAAQTFTVNNPAPTLSSINPTNANAGSSNLSVALVGTGFVSTSVANWNGTPLTTTYGSSTTLNATIPAADMTTVGTFWVTVTNPTPGGGTSNPVVFTVNNPAPTLTSITPPSAPVGSSDLDVALVGAGFVPDSVANWDGTTLDTTYVDSSDLTATIEAGDMTTAGTFPVTVTSPTPGGGTSNSVTFTVTTPLTGIGAITGTAQVGQTLIAGALSPSGATASYQWQYSSSSGGPYTNISGATSSTYTISSSYVNDYIEVTATGTGNYSGPVTSSATAVVATNQLTISTPTLTTTKTYDGGTTAAVTAGTLSGVVSGDTVTVSAAANYDNKNVGTGKTITVVYTLGGADAGKYVAPVNYTVTTGVINAAQVTGIGAITGTAQVGQTLIAGALTPSAATVNYQWQWATTSGGSYTAISGATASTYTISSSYVNDFIEVVATGTGNYSGSATSAATAAVATNQLTISTPTLTTTKTYDGGTTAAVTAGTLSGVVSGDTVTVSAAANYDNKNVGTGKTITVVYTLGGADAGKYVAPVNYSVTTGVINAIQLTISTPTLTTTKTYDGGTTAAVTAGTLSGVVSGDTVIVSAAANYDNATVGTGKTITVVYTLGGADAGNYIAPVNYTVTNGVINAAQVTGIGAITGTVQVNQTLTAGAVTPSAATVNYQWQWATTSGGSYTAISGATSSTYTISSSYVNDYIEVVATGTGNYTGSATSGYVGPVAAASTPLTSVTISGNVQLYQTLTANVSPSGATVTYQWQYSTNGTTYSNISGATSITYTITTPVVAGNYIKVQATGTGSYTGTVTSGATTAVTTRSWSTTGGPSTSYYNYALAYDPTNDVVYAGTTSNGVYKYTVSSSTWSGGGSGQPGLYDMRSLAYDSVNSMLYAGTYSLTNVYKLNGSTWSTTGGPGSYDVFSLADDSSSRNVLYAGTYYYGVYRCNTPKTSTTWTSISGNWSYAYIYSLAYDSVHDMLFAGTSGSNVYRCPTPESATSSTTWTTIGNNLPSDHVDSLAYDSVRDKLYAGMDGHGVYRMDSPESATSSSQWVAINNGISSSKCYSLAYDSTNNVLYTGTNGTGNGVWVCTGPDSATSSTAWTDTGGPGSWNIYSLVYDSVHNRLYAGDTTNNVRQYK